MIETIRPCWSAPSSIRACCTTRTGGVSEPPFDGFNLAKHVGDDENNVTRNRALLRQSLELPGEPCWIRQTHGTRVVTLEQDPGRDADAAVTRKRGKVAVVMTADCLPVLLCNRAGTEVAAVHAGWRGLQAGIVESALDAMDSPADSVIAWIGPGISRGYFEVGDEVRAAFAGTIDGALEYFLSNRPNHWLCDLGGLAERVLARRGVSQVYRDSHCSYRDAGLLYSYRRDGTTGRMATLIWIN